MMETATYKTSMNDQLEVTGKNLTVVTLFGNTYRGWVDEKGYVNTKAKLGLGYLVRAFQEYKKLQNCG
jgi:hypothetical protein